MAMACRLCRLPKVLKNSHIIPSWVFRRIIDGNSAGVPASPVRISADTWILDPDQRAEKLLCVDCEALLEPAESYVADVSRQNNGNFLALTYVTPSPEDSRLG